ncbi:MAG: MFS transporter, partial [Gemmatimonadaceae bacterium]
TTDLIVGSAPRERAGAAAAISETSAEFGGAMGIAMFGSIGIAVYRRLVDDALPAGIPAEAAEAAQATLGGALAVAGQLPSEVATPLVEAAREAFIRGLQLTAAISVLGSIALAIFAGLTLRNARPGSHAGAESDSEPALSLRMPTAEHEAAG